MKQKLTRDAFADFMFARAAEIKSYKFDIFHDIRAILNFAYTNDEYSTSEPVQRHYIFYVRDAGTWLVEEGDISFEEAVQKSFKNNSCYRITITKNCDYLVGYEFAEVEELTL